MAGKYRWEARRKVSPEGAGHLPSSLNISRLLGRPGRAAGAGHGAAGDERAGLLLLKPCRRKCFDKKPKLEHAETGTGGCTSANCPPALQDPQGLCTPS